MAKKTKKTRFVPPMILGSAVIASVIPAVVGMTACSDDNGSQQYAVGTGFVAATFDASADTNGFTVAANFDAGTDANGFAVGASFDAGGNGGHDSGEG